MEASCVTQTASTARIANLLRCRWSAACEPERLSIPSHGVLRRDDSSVADHDERCPCDAKIQTTTINLNPETLYEDVPSSRISSALVIASSRKSRLHCTTWLGATFKICMRVHTNLVRVASGVVLCPLLGVSLLELTRKRINNFSKL